jgi:hypothetical protein
MVTPQMSSHVIFRAHIGERKNVRKVRLSSSALETPSAATRLMAVAVRGVAAVLAVCH